MKIVHELESAGYDLALSGDTIVLEFKAQGTPDPAIVQPLVAQLQTHKPEAIAYLKNQSIPVNGFDGPDADFYWKALDAHQRGWSKLYWRGETYPIAQQFGQLSRTNFNKDNRR
jgi:hypothetical protein